MLSYDPISSLQHYPVAGGIKRFGVNPYGEALYRIVFAPSRRYLVVGEWPNGADCAQWARLYSFLGFEPDGVTPKQVWVMERWLPAEQFAKCSREEWNRDNLVLGCWPDRGDYELCHVFDVAPPSDANIHKLVEMVEAGRRIPFSETRAFHEKDSAREKKATTETAQDMIRNRLPAYGSTPFVGGHVHRGSKTAPIMRSAEELGLPTRPGVLQSGRRNNNPVSQIIESPQRAA